ncbi:uncharacterized protein LOC107418533 isoform X1 [Ziziphus jujuba]|uniref:Uncharacterized protein LOC107418533 isoform X1 n=1 Tax=Ziziphus jujuba TaxID=326968 RepID=A0A6P3ZT37_ZIZJJ|nr:uncharacterized protein LOC107418533 isoform X1 [Ziziphus jujuba]
MAIVTGDRYIERLVKFVEQQAGPLIEGTLVLKLNPVGLHYVQSRLEALNELESLLAGAPVDYLRAYVSDLGDHRALEQLRRILRLLTSLKVVSVLQAPARDPTPLSLLPFGRLRVLELRGCDLSTSAAKGLLELRHTLEKIICHNSTDALRHIFASRIAEIKGSPQWKRLSFVSCACNGLVLMDESLQLLPAVETLDLSRNKFAKVDNLRKCVKLKHLDLGFNQLRAISSFSEVSCHIGKLVLRNNALTTFRGIENLKSLEGLDVSYNIISNFSELEFLSGLQFLQNLWLEGNPICCARWYRPQVFGYFSHPEKLKLDDKEISTREMWKRQLIIARRQRRPASFGFYSPAKCDATGEGSIHRKRKKVTRLASIEGEEESTYLNSDEESVSIDNEIQSREEAVVSDNEAEIVDLMNRVELMKKERSILWLREFKEWMDHTSENFVDHTKYCTAILDPGRENLIKTKPSHRHYGESSRYASDSVQASGDESSTNVLESDSSFTYTTAGLHAEQYFERTGLVGNTGGVGQAGMGKMDLKEEYLKAYPYERISSVSAQPKSSRADIFVNQGGHRTADNLSISPLTTIDDISESHSSSAYPGSPPHYQEDILHRRHYLEEEILQLSAESYSIASSDSNTSCSQDDICDFMPSTSGTDQAMNGEYSNNFAECPYLKNFEGNCYGQRHQISHIRENGQRATNSYVDQIFGKQKLTNPDHSVHSHNDIPAGTCDDVNKEDDFFDKRKSRRKTKRRVISLIDDNISAGKVETSEKTNGNHGFHVAEGEQEQPSKSIFGSDFQKDIDRKYILTSKIRTPLNEDALGSPEAKCLSLRCDDFIKNYFNTNVADSKSHEICMQYMRCYCLLEQAFQSREREVALILSSKQKMYVLLFGGAGDETGTTLSLLGCHRVEDIREVFVGVGLQVVRVCIERSATYLFITRDVEKSRQLLCSLQDFDSFGANDKCCLRSLEQVQVELFEKQIFGGLKVSIFQYSMVLFWYNNHEEGSWVSRSLFVIGVHLLMCIEDLVRFGSLSEDASSPPYYSLDSCCAINDISEMVVEAKESCCVTLQLECATSVFNPSAKFGKGLKGFDKKTASSSLAWKLKWFSEESLFKFVALVKAIHSGTSTSPLLIRCTS